MSDKQKNQNIDQLMAEADELVRKINSDVIGDMQEKHRLEFEQHAKKLKKLKSGLAAQDSDQKDPTSQLTASAEGIHEAFEDIVNAMKELKDKFS